MRARNIKPGFFRNEQLMQVAPLGRLLFAGLWCLADREGRLYDRPRQIKWDILPADDCDINSLLDDLARRGFIRRYSVDGIGYIEVVNFLRHQRPHYKETASTLPPPTISPTQILGQHRLIPDTRYSDTVSSDSGFSATDYAEASLSGTGYAEANPSGTGYADTDCCATRCTDSDLPSNDNITDGNTNTSMTDQYCKASPANAGKADAGCEASHSMISKSDAVCAASHSMTSIAEAGCDANHSMRGMTDTTRLTASFKTDIPAFVKSSMTDQHCKASPANAGIADAGCDTSHSMTSIADAGCDASHSIRGMTDTTRLTMPHATDIPASASRLLALWHRLSTHHTTADRHYIESALQHGYREATLSALFYAKHTEYRTARSKKNFTLANLLGKKLPHHLANLATPTQTASTLPTKPTPTQTASALPSKPTPTQTASALPSKPAPTQTAPTLPSKAGKHTPRWTEAFFADESP